MKKFLKWFFGISFILSGLGQLASGLIPGLLTIGLGLFLIPPILRKLEAILAREISTSAKWVIIVSTLVVLGVFIQRNESKDDHEMDLLVMQAKALIGKGKLDTALILIEQAKSKYHSKENAAIDLEKDIQKSESMEYVQEVLSTMADEEFNLLHHTEFSQVYFESEYLNKRFIQLLRDNAHKRELMIEEQRKKEEQEQLIRAKAKAEVAKRLRAKKIETIFSPWDGSHFALERLIKKSMNDPDSYEHIGTTYRDDVHSIFVVTKFRGTNAFGAKVLTTVTAQVDFEGNVIEVLNQY